MTGEPAWGSLAVGLFGLIWIVFVVGWIVAVVVFLVAAWRAMKAHERLADSAKEALDLLRSKAGI